MNSTEIPMVNIPLASKAHQLAEQFAAEQISADKYKQVYLNTLSVYAVSRYLKRLQVETDLSQGDSWNAVKRLLFDVADLVLPGIGKLECRWVMPGETACALPEDVPEDLIGYLVVQFPKSLDQAQLLGFYPAVAGINPPEQIQLKELQPREVFIDQITKLEAQIIRRRESVVRAKRINLTNANHPASGQPKVEENNLSQWLKGFVEQGWETFREAFSTPDLSPAYAMRRNATKDSVVLKESMVLVVALTPITEQKVRVWIELHSCVEKLLLPKNLQLMIIDQSGEIFEQKSMEQDGKLLKAGRFSAQKGERFTVKVVEGDNIHLEDFVLDFNS
ncbi:MAG: DUF1822 family protein [Symploca sp. SIO2D2]|nr:DUF1822 family protein [Symploca sp. SIO2D2]